MKIYQYTDYKDYVAAQTEANHVKLDHIYVSAHTIDRVVSLCPQAASVLCHGTRNGAEQRLFQQRLSTAKVLGTEISDTALQFADTVQWDFHDVKAEWIGAWNIVYSNSFDHSNDPVRALTTWREQLSPDGSLFIEHSPHVKSRRWDPLEINSEELQALFRQVDLIIKSQWNSCSAKHISTTVYQLGVIS